MKFIKFMDIKIGDKAEFERMINADDIDSFAKLIGDLNPLHVDDTFARKTRFGGRIAHGMLTASFISQVIGMTLPGRGALYLSQHCEFLKPVRIGDRIRVVVIVERLHKSINVLSLKTEIFNQEGSLVINGNAKVMVMSDLLEDRYKHDKSKEDTIIDSHACGYIRDGMNLKNKIALVTGSGRGIGAEIARLLSLSGASVVINYIRDDKSANKLADEINKNNCGRAITIKADISKIDEVKSMFAEIRKRLGDVDILINNASQSLENKAFVSADWDDFDRHLNTILKGACNCCWEAVEGMKKKGSGKIINILSSVIYGAQKSMTSYTTAKFGLLGLSKSMALELAALNITVNTVSPGMTETDLIAYMPDYVKKTAGAKLPLKRIATPKDIAMVVLFLAGEGADYMTGIDIPVCGGEHI